MEAIASRISRLFGIRYPLIQAGMVWASGHRLASAVSLAGGLGIIGAGSMTPGLLEEHIRKCRATVGDRPFAVNLPLLNPVIKEHVEVVLRERAPIVFTSAGNPKTFTKLLKDQGVVVVHVVGSSKFAVKAEQAGCDAVVAEGFEAGGHNSREETTTLCLIPAVARAVSIPVIAAGGIGDGRAMLACMVLGAEGVQVGSRFVACQEASSHPAFKEAVIKAQEGDTMLTMKKLVPVRMLRNPFFDKVCELQEKGAGKDELAALLGRGRSKRGMFEGDLVEGELEIGQVSALLRNLPSAASIVSSFVEEFHQARLDPLGFPPRGSWRQRS